MSKKKRTFKDFDKQFYISLTQLCNWKCWYCDFPKIKNKTTAPIDYVIKIFEMIKEATNYDDRIEYCLEGGEIGLLDVDYLDKVFYSNLSETYTVTTNGLFLKKGYHHKYADKIHYILYHVQPEIVKDNYDFPDYDFDPSILVHYTIVINKNNLPYIPQFLDKHQDKIFLPHILQPRTEGLDFLTKKDYQYLYTVIKDRENICPHFIQRVKRIISMCENQQWLNNKRKICANVYSQPIFDLPRRRINRCCISITGDSVPLTKENIIKLHNNEPLFNNIMDKVCDGCIANFLWHDFRHEKQFKKVISIFKYFSR